MNKNIENELAIYQAKDGSIELRVDATAETIWATQAQIAEIFNIDRTVATKHVNNLIKQGEVDEKSNVQKMHIANSDRPVSYYSLDIILGVGYRANSKNAIKFRRWATTTLKQYLLDGFVINPKAIESNYLNFLDAIDKIKVLSAGKENKISHDDTMSLVQLFASTWMSLDAYDKSDLPITGTTLETIFVTATELNEAISELKQELIAKDQTTPLFA